MPTTLLDDGNKAGEVLPDSSARPITPQELAGMSTDQLRIARNEIYARHGYVFSTADMKAHFGAFAWYRPITATITPSMFSQVEQQNINTIKAAESAGG